GGSGAASSLSLIGAAPMASTLSPSASAGTGVPSTCGTSAVVVVSAGVPASFAFAASTCRRSNSAIDSSGLSSSGSSSAPIGGIADLNSSSGMIGATSGNCASGGGGVGTAISGSSSASEV